ncbi:MAG: hypothetical protein PHH58_01365 [Rhodoferax sp.]|nr:hypothetical protein [Rhodoferax sp.]
MTTQSPFSLLQDFFQKLPLPNFQPPAWAVAELQNRVVLLLNHVLMQEAEAMTRLARHKGQVMQVQWCALSFKLQATPAGLLELAAAERQADLVLTVTEVSPVALAQGVLKGDKPAVRIAGDVQLAAEVSWLTEHVRWDLEEDLARVMGDVPAHTLAQMVATAVSGLRQFVSKVSGLVPGKAA